MKDYTLEELKELSQGCWKRGVTAFVAMQREELIDIIENKSTFNVMTLGLDYTCIDYWDNVNETEVQVFGFRLESSLN